jgi:hypothetical protein
MSTKLASSFYRTAGISYLRYLNLSTTYARKVVKADLRAVYGAREQLHYKVTPYAAGEAGAKDLVTAPKLE